MPDFFGFKMMNKYDKNFVTNIETDQIDTEKYLKVAKQLNIPAWFGRSVGSVLLTQNTAGFYVHHSVKNLTEFWDTLDSLMQ